MNKEKLKEYIRKYLDKSGARPPSEGDMTERRQRVDYYRSWTADRLRSMTEEELFEYISKLWAMRIWGNKQYVVDKLLEDHGLEKVRNELAELIWADSPVEKRWDRFRNEIKGMGPAMMSEILAHVFPDQYMLWNRRAYVGLEALGVDNLPRYNYQLTGEKYKELCDIVGELAKEMQAEGVKDANMLTVDYFIWDELQADVNLSQIFTRESLKESDDSIEKADAKTSEFIHDEVKEKIANIGRWLGFEAETEKKIAGGAIVDALWEATIGNMGRVIYVFEVQTKGSKDSLILNLLKSLNNPAVQGVVAVSDDKQLDSIKSEVVGVRELGDKLKYWNYKDVLKVHEALETVNESINSLGLVPQGF